MEKKSASATFKALKTPGEFEAEFSVFGNIDLDGDRMMAGCFKSAFEANPTPAVIWTHMWDIPPIGQTLDASETETGAKGTARLFLDDHEVARQCWAGLKSGALKEFSYAFDFNKSGFELVATKDGEESPRPDGRVREISALKNIYEWGPTLRGANPLTSLTDIAKAGTRFAAAARRKSYEDIDSWEISCLTGMIDYGTSFIVSEVDADDVATMKGILASILDLLATELQEARDAGDDLGLYYDSFRKALSGPGLAGKAGARNSADDQARLQTIHDLAMECGAACAPNDPDTVDIYGASAERDAEVKERLASLRMLDFAR